MAVVAEELLPEWRLRESFLKHAARGQLHRLRAAVREDVPFDDIFATTEDGDSFAARWRGKRLPLLDDLRIELAGENRIEAVKPNGALAATFARTGEVLPRLTKLAATEAEVLDESSGSDRARSAVHHFIGLVEHPARDPQPFRELLARRFSLGYTPTPTTNLMAFDAWVKGALSSVVASEHVIHAIDVTDWGGGQLEAEVRMTSQALFPDGSGAISRNAQRWMLHDTTGDRFPRIERIDIARDAVEFFGPAPLYAPRQRP